VTKYQELKEELAGVLSGRASRILDSFAPLLVFLIVTPIFGLNIAIYSSLGLAALLAVLRILRRESLVYALGGLGGVSLASVFALLSGSGRGFFLPGLISGTVTVVLCVLSVTLNRPLVAWTSFVTRRWPIEWYWHARVLPAYNEVTIGWAVAFAGRLALEFWLYQQDALGALGTARIILGWPFIVILLVTTYLYGMWRLRRLGGPSVQEFKEGKAPPWEGQKRGF
jgi:hypothetical protein